MYKWGLSHHSFKTNYNEIRRIVDIVSLVMLQMNCTGQIWPQKKCKPEASVFFGYRLWFFVKFGWGCDLYVISLKINRLHVCYFPTNNHWRVLYMCVSVIATDSKAEEEATQRMRNSVIWSEIKSLVDLFACFFVPWILNCWSFAVLIY